MYSRGCRTESYDDLGPVGEDPRWDIFAKFHAYLRVSFPKTFATTSVTAVNTYGLVLHWAGSDPSLKPILLTAHQDVVPVDPNTAKNWKYPPYSGHYDGASTKFIYVYSGSRSYLVRSGKYIWGRGSEDDKSGLIGILYGSLALRFAQLWLIFFPCLARPSKPYLNKVSILEERSSLLREWMKKFLVGR